MTKFTGLSNLYLGGVDVSGDVGTISSVSGQASMIDVSGLDVAGFERLSGRRDGSINFNAWFGSGAHAVLGNIPTTSKNVLLAIPASAGGLAAMTVLRQVNYDVSVANDLGVGATISLTSALGIPVVWGKMVTAKRTDTGATATGTGIDLGLPSGVAAVDIVSSSEADPTVITTDGAHGLLTGDSVLIAGHTGSTPSINGGHTVTRINDTTYSIPVEVTGAGTGGTSQRTSHHGWSAMLQVFSISGTSVTVRIQNAPNNQAGQFVDLTGGAFTAATGATSERKTGTGIVQRFVRAASAGTFNPATYAVGIHVERD